MPPKKESKKVVKVAKVAKVETETESEIASIEEDNALTLDNILNPIDNDNQESTKPKKSKKITLNKKKVSTVAVETDIEEVKIIEQKAIKPVSIKKKKTNKIIYKKTEAEIANTLDNENFKYKFLEFLNKMHNLLRGCAVTGEPALDDILNTLFLCYIEDKISDKGLFDFENSEKDCYLTIHNKIKEYSKYLKVNYLLEHIEEFKKNEGQLNSIEKCGKIFKLHPTTKLLFKDDNFINCPDPVIFSKLLRECQDFSKKQNIFENIDIAGIAYEYMTTKHAGNGGMSKEMGQYFTERPLMEMCFMMIDPEDIKELKINDDSTIGDEFCATFGFPLMGRKFLKEKFNINIKDKNMYGVEYAERLSRFAIMNAMFSMETFENITRGDSFITNVTPHLDVSVHNVPFGKSMIPENIKKTYDNFIVENPNKGYPELKNYIPFCNKKIDAILASQAVLYKTKKMGLMIIKDGEETSGKSNADYRKWFGENCIIKKILKIPCDAFTCTKTKTVCIYFIKKEGKMTENIQFLQLSDDGNKITEICNVSMNDLQSNNYSWDPNGYVLDEEMEKIMAKSKCEWKKLGDVCIMLPTTKHYTSIGKETGLYRFYNSSQKDKLYIDKYEINKESIIFGNGGELCVHYDTQFTASKHVTIIQTTNNIINIKYIYNYLLFNIDNIKLKSTGGGIQWFNKEKISNIMIPIPAIEIQNEIVQMLDDLSTQKQLLNDRKTGIENQMKYYFKNQIKKNKDSIKLITIKELCNTVSGKQLSESKFIEGNYYVIGGGQKPAGKHNKFNKEANNILCSQSGSYSGFISRYNTPIWASDCFSIHSLNKEILTEDYLYYYLIQKQNNIYKLQTGGGQPHIYQDNINNFDLLLPNIDKQKEIVDYLDKLENKKNSIDDELKDIDSLMKSILEQSYE